MLTIRCIKLANAIFARTLFALAFAFIAISGAHAQLTPEQAAFNKKINPILRGDWRSEDNKARDKYRHPDRTLRFFGLQSDSTVVELIPGGGWYAEILAPFLKDNGHYIAASPKPSKPDGEAAKSLDALRKRISDDADHFGGAQVVEFDSAAPAFGAPDSADFVLTFRNVHNWTDDGNAEAMFKAAFAVLKPGGVLGVVDHRANPGTDAAKLKDSGYLTQDQVIKLAHGAGFKLVGISEANANPKDTKDYPKGVWTLPPSLALGDQDKAKYVAIGESDRMTLKFRKPEAK